MDLQIRKLTPELLDDYLRFFDTTPHSTGKSEHRCYCVCWAGTRGDAQACSTAEKRRAVAAEYIRKHLIRGYLAYADGRVVGWCSANTKSDCYECISWKMFMGGIRKDETNVKSVFCFAIAPEYRRCGIASALLKRVCEDAGSEGFDSVEAYPNTKFRTTEDDFMGPAPLYHSLGFVPCYAAGDKTVMRKDLHRQPDESLSRPAGNSVPRF